MKARIRCQARVLTGPRRNQQCRAQAIALVTAEMDNGLPVCGNHKRAWLDRALARIAYYNPKTQSWP